MLFMNNVQALYEQYNQNIFTVVQPGDLIITALSHLVEWLIPTLTQRVA